MMRSKSTRFSPFRDRAGRLSRRFLGEVTPLEDRKLLSEMTAPTTTANAVGSLGSNGYYTSPVTIQFSATDPDDPSASLTTKFRVNNGALTVGSSVTLTGDGVYDIDYSSQDPAGNVEAT